MKILYYTAGVSGSGHIVLGISVGLGLRRADPAVDYRVLHPESAFGALCDRMGIAHAGLPQEDENALGPERYRDSALFKALSAENPDILIVDMHWFTLDAMLDELPCRKIFISRQVHPRFFAIPLPGRKLTFEPSRWDERIAIEPWEPPFPMRRIDPIVLRNRDEIPGRAEALRMLGVSGDKPVFLLAMNANAGDFERAKALYSHLDGEGWDTVYSSNYHDGLFPIVDCFAAVDLLACGGGYNAFWEAMYFEKETVFLPQQGRFEDVRGRVETCTDYVFKENGADTLARIALGM